MGLIPVVAVAGPTASGKTKLAVEIALRYGGEVVSADSMQVYKGFDIGTAKPDETEKRGVPHHMIDVAAPSQTFSVAAYVPMARACIEDIHSRGKLPVVAGGTGLYMDCLLNNIVFTPEKRDPALRVRLQEQARLHGGESLLAVLRQFDPECATKLHPNNIGRIVRAIEVYKTTGETMTQAQARSRSAPALYHVRKIGLCFGDRAQLYARINARVDEMMARGLVGEVRALVRVPGVRGSTAMQAIGYKEIAAYLDGSLTLEQAEEAVKQGTRRYAKRQMTWLKRDDSIHWIPADSEDYENICKQAFAILDKWI